MGERDKRGDLAGGAKSARSQSPRSTEAVEAARSPGSKTGSRAGRAGRWVCNDREQPMKAATVPKGAIRGAEAHEIPGVEAAIWTERMVSALVNGVEGGKWYSQSTLAQRLLCRCRAVRFIPRLAAGERLPMRKPPTGEPCAGEPHARFGGRGGDEPSLPLSGLQPSTRLLQLHE